MGSGPALRRYLPVANVGLPEVHWSASQRAAVAFMFAAVAGGHQCQLLESPRGCLQISKTPRLSVNAWKCTCPFRLELKRWMELERGSYLSTKQVTE